MTSAAERTLALPFPKPGRFMVRFTSSKPSPWGYPYAWSWGPYRTRASAEREADTGRRLHPDVTVEVVG